MTGAKRLCLSACICLSACAGVEYNLKTPIGYELTVKDYTDKTGVIFYLELEGKGQMILLKDQVIASEAIKAQANAAAGASKIIDLVK